MKAQKIKHLLELLDQLKQLSEVQLNKHQSEFIKCLEIEPLDTEALNSFLKDEKIYKNLSNDFRSIEPLSQDMWTSFSDHTKIKSIDAETEEKEESNKKTSKASNIIYYDVKFIKEDWDIAIKLRKPEEPVPTDIFSFIKSIDEVQHAINELYTNEQERTSHLKSLEGIARVGGTSTYIELAKQQLGQYKKEIVLQKGSEIKLKYLKELGLSGLALSSLCLIALLLHSVLNIQYQYEHLFRNAILLIIGSCIGTWLSFAIRKKEILFEDLRLLHGNKRNPLMRMLVLVLIALCFYFMFITNFLNIKIGESFSTAVIGGEGYESLAFLIGIFIGLTENTIGPTLTNRIESFTSKL